MVNLLPIMVFSFLLKFYFLFCFVVVFSFLVSPDLFPLTLLFECLSLHGLCDFIFAFFLESLKEAQPLKCHHCFKFKYLWVFLLFCRKALTLKLAFPHIYGGNTPAL